MLRSTPPSLTRSATKMFDDATLAAYDELAPLDPPTDTQNAQRRLPLRLGGRNIRSQQTLADFKVAKLDFIREAAIANYCPQTPHVHSMKAFKVSVGEQSICKF